ncbi:MAG: hypothetical protein ABIO16_03955 [Nocardioides sp.]
MADRSVVADVVPERVLIWDTVTSGARWVWELSPEGTGTLVVHRRPIPRQVTRITRLYSRAFLGGVSRHADDLESDMALSVARLKAAVEG